MRIEWQIEGRIRCDVVAYAGKNLNGKRTTMRIFPSGSQQGGIDSSELVSMVVRAPYGTRILLITHPEGDWQRHPWRCIRMLKGKVMGPGKSQLAGARIPDLDLLDRGDAKKTDPDLQSSYPYVDALADGVGWTFGRGGPGGLKRRVKLIRIERETAGSGVRLGDTQRALVSLAGDIVAEGGAADLVAAVLTRHLVASGVSAEQASAVAASLDE